AAARGAEWSLPVARPAADARGVVFRTGALSQSHIRSDGQAVLASGILRPGDARFSPQWRLRDLRQERGRALRPSADGGWSSLLAIGREGSGSLGRRLDLRTSGPVVGRQANRLMGRAPPFNEGATLGPSHRPPART